mmetsp:Transcript_59039/g.80622  ORF Transcript_59039/g.80622 Transcript_59039/m.80622 type:complete len:256 (-) Transcript_59039:309-1076(-)|eukprot:CAMPEP_0185756870 /NCGR_PEP_ID=MMETSP1174-20130828/15262_1 /TAXON_ID=35687 /ORGANISM="Dictyocha speculum, Strain CCMP1381" /LENGTH=255 /DNA_ID=CAMNT_0028436009 /DNA_START=73 /DNA_END=840 /DNA_ORIENTATION=-
MSSAHGPADEQTAGNVTSKKDWRQKKKKSSRKNQIRSLQRLLSKEVGEDAKKSIQEKLAVLQEEVVVKTQQVFEQKRVLKYRKNKFFDRKKLERRLKAAQKTLEEGDEGEASKDALNKEIRRLQEDLIYVNHFPKKEKYMSLHAKEYDEKTKKRMDNCRKQAMALAKEASVAISTDTKEENSPSKDEKKSPSATNLKVIQERVEKRRRTASDAGPATETEEDSDAFFMEAPERSESTNKIPKEEKKKHKHKKQKK